jgi:hypothetical protein
MRNGGMLKQSTQQAATNGASTQRAPLKGEERKEVLEQRKLLIDLQNQSSQSFDKTLIALAGGALTISIGFIRQTVPVALPGTTIWLALSWLFLILSLFASFFSQFTSQYGLMKSCEELDSEYLGGPLQRRPSYAHIPGRAYMWVRVKCSDFCEHRMTTNYLNVVSIVCCVVGVGFLALFVVLNFPQLQVPLSK